MKLFKVCLVFVLAFVVVASPLNVSANTSFENYSEEIYQFATKGDDGLYDFDSKSAKKSGFTQEEIKFALEVVEETNDSILADPEAIIYLGSYEENTVGTRSVDPGGASSGYYFVGTKSASPGTVLSLWIAGGSVVLSWWTASVLWHAIASTSFSAGGAVLTINSSSVSYWKEYHAKDYLGGSACKVKVKRVYYYDSNYQIPANRTSIHESGSQSCYTIRD